MATFETAPGGAVIVDGAALQDDNGHWRHARLGGWCLYEGSAYSRGRQARPELQSALTEFARITGAVNQ